MVNRRRPGLAVRSGGRLALGGDAARGIAVLRAGPEVFDPVASDPAVSRLIARLATDPTPR